MGFCLLRRDGDAVALIVSRVFETRAEALGEISRLSAGEGMGADEVFVVDIDAAMPVLIVTPAAQESPDDAVAPDALEPEPAYPRTSETDQDRVAGVIEVEAVIAEAVVELNDLETVPPVEEAAAEEPPAEEPPVQTWPWDVADIPEAENATATPESGEAESVADTASGTEEPLAGGSAVVESETSEAEPTEAEAVAPEEIPDEVEPTEDVTELTPPEQPAAPEEELPDEVSGLLADLEEIVPSVPASRESADALAPDSPQTAVEPDTLLPEEPAKAYEPGTSDLTDLTCDDCIYLNTCPKKDESDPSNCGSFQWKSI